MPTQPVSSPVVPPQPDAATYSVQELALFKTFSRETYRAAFGLEAPPFDPSRPIKAWFDSTVDASHPDNVAIYKIPGLDAQNQWTLRQLVMKATEAATLNLTGSVRYPEYVVAPTLAAREGATINPIYLSLESEARYWMDYFGGSELGDEASKFSPFVTVYPSDEPRRLWYFLYRGVAVNVGALMWSRHRGGVDAPGSWNTSGDSPQWVPDPSPPTGIHGNYPACQIPLRELLPNERLEPGGLMGGVYVVRTDRQRDVADALGRFTEEDRALLREIHRLVSR